MIHHVSIPATDPRHAAEGWRADVVSRGPHDLVEFRVENAVMVEDMTPEMTAVFLAAAGGSPPR